MTSSWWNKKIYYPLWRKWNWFIDIPQEIKWFIQRGRRGYADCDVWSIDGYLSEWLPSAIRDLKGQKWGHPINLKNQREWNNILEKMVRGFSSADSIMRLDFMKDTRPEVWKPKEKKLYRQFDEGMRLFHKYFFNLWN